MVPATGRFETWRGPLYVTLASDSRPWAVARGGAPGRHGHPVHMVRRVFLAWKAGRPVGMLVQTECGSKLLTAALFWGYELTDRRCVRCPANKRSRELAAADRAFLAGAARSH
jgi:hypothetical protein